jgi:hypothetical protein
MPRSTVGLVLRRLGLGRLKALDAAPPAIRYQRERPGELIHIDTKKLGRMMASATASPATIPGSTATAASGYIRIPPAIPTEPSPPDTPWGDTPNRKKWRRRSCF